MDIAINALVIVACIVAALALFAVMPKLSFLSDRHATFRNAKPGAMPLLTATLCGAAVYESRPDGYGTLLAFTVALVLWNSMTDQYKLANSGILVTASTKAEYEKSDAL